MALLSFIYVSTPTRVLTAHDMMGLLRTARVRNALEGLTGILLYTGDSFAQVLEGEQAPLDATLARIQADPRHRNVVVLSKRQISARSFDAHPMAFATDKHYDALAGTIHLTDPRSVSGLLRLNPASAEGLLRALRPAMAV